MEYLKTLLKKYQEMSKHSDYISISEVTSDLYQAIKELRIMRVPKKDR